MESSYLSQAEAAVIDAYYQQWRENPASVDESWQKFFEGFEFARTDFGADKEARYGMPDEFKVINLINAYRQRGHLFTLTNPVRTRRSYLPTLELENFGLKESDLKRPFHAGKELGLGTATLESILSHLNETYCRHIGAEYFYIRKVEVNQWLRERMESSRNRPAFSPAESEHLLYKLSEAVYFEKFVHKKFPGQKRFSLEGAEALIPALDAVLEHGADMGNQEFVIGMAHRGRLNVLANILGKSTTAIFTEFEGKAYEDALLLGDVKYHLGYTSERTTQSGKQIKLTLAPNPSHLEAVGPVVQGIVRARIDHLYQGDQEKITPILIHGDASIAGQGVIYELQQMSELRGYATGGTIHLVVNNQVGFTTNYLDARSSTYCTDVAKVTQSPVFHVNGDDVESLVYTIKLAMEFRARFKRDVFIDMLCYRKYGHNESDEPRFTQPLLYKAIEKHPDPLQIYGKQLTDKKVMDMERVEQIKEEINQKLEASLSEARQKEKASLTSFLAKTWKDIRKASPEDFHHSPDTSIPEIELKRIADRITRVPDDIALFRKIVRLQQERNDMVFKHNRLDWAMGELLAYGSLLREGIPVRLSGQDVERGTFSHRHAVLTREDTGEAYIPLNQLDEQHAHLDIINSPLSEYGVLGFEYGYALTSPHSLTIWEAQFGDFNNGAQIIIDQFISSAEDKWNVMNDLVLLLPHGYEGQGPEHSSARMERFLAMCADLNMQVANPTTPANFFHLLRRQLKRPFRKPLIIFTPKSLLRHPECVSSVEDFTRGGFREVIDDGELDPLGVRKLVFSTGKLYYELKEERQKRKAWDTALVRIEQLYPLPEKQLQAVVERYPNAYKYIWSQEEPANMGAWSYLKRKFNIVDLMLVARPESGSPATGSPSLHRQRQDKILEKTFAGCTCERVNEECRMVCAPKEWTFVSRLQPHDAQDINTKIENPTSPQ